MIVGLTIAGVIAASLAWMTWLAFTAPHGWQDSEGWHEGEPPCDGDA